MAQADDIEVVLDGRRSFNIETEEGETLTYYIANPNGESIRKADWQYAKVYNEAIQDGLFTQAQMLDVLKERGIISEEQTQKIENTRATLAAELFTLEGLPEDAPEEDREAGAVIVAQLRDELFQLNQKINGPLGNTCENVAEDARLEFLTSRIIETKDKKPLWKDFEAYRQEENTALAIKARFEVMLWMQGLDSDFLDNTPERIILRNIAQERIEKVIKDLEEEEEENKENQKEKEKQTEKEDKSSTTTAEEVVSLDEVPETTPKKTKLKTKKIVANKKPPSKKKRGRPPKVKTETQDKSEDKNKEE